MPFAGSVWYEESGAGRPFLFIHGWCMSSAVWKLQQDACAARYRFIALDLRGHGNSPETASTGKTGFADYADDIISLAEQLDLHDIIAVGWSMGAQALLKAWPHISHRTAGLILTGATPRFSAAPHFSHGLPPKEAEGMRLKVRRNQRRAIEGFQRNLFTDSEQQDSVLAAEVAGIMSAIRTPSATAALCGLEALMEEEVMEEARLVSCPALIMHGDMDKVCLPEASVWLEQNIRNSTRRCYTGCGHAPFLSRYQQFNTDILEFAGELHGTD